MIDLPVVELNNAISESTDRAVFDETSHDHAGVAQVPSHRQNVVALAPVPDPRFVTGRFPVTPVESDTFVMVFEEPLIVLFVNDCVSVVPTIAHVTQWADVADICVSIWACVLVPAPLMDWCAIFAWFTVSRTLSPCVASFDHTATVSRLLAERNFSVSLHDAVAVVIPSVTLA